MKKVNENKIKMKSQVILDDLDDEIVEAVESYNDNIHQIFVKCMKDQNNSVPSELEYELPISKYSFYKNESTYKDGTIESLLINSASMLNTEIVSPFAALSGCSDNQKSFHVKEKSYIPHFKAHCLDYQDIYPTMLVSNRMNNFHGHEIKLNSYVLDFYNHGDFAAILYENRISSDEASNLLKDFNIMLRNLYSICNNYFLKNNSNNYSSSNSNKNKKSNSKKSDKDENNNVIIDDALLMALEKLKDRFDQKIRMTNFDFQFSKKYEI
jgi:hypothetical protein